MITIKNDKNKIYFEHKFKLGDKQCTSIIEFDKNKNETEVFDEFEEIFDEQVEKYGLDNVFIDIHNSSHEYIKFWDLINHYDRFYKMMYNK